MQHVLDSIKPTKKDFNQEEAITLCEEWIVNSQSQRTCQRFSGSSHRNTSCGCMFFLQEVHNADIVRAIAAYMVHWAALPRETKRNLIYDWNRISGHLGKTIAEQRKNTLAYIVPMIGEICPRGCTQLICQMH